MAQDRQKMAKNKRAALLTKWQRIPNGIAVHKKKETCTSKPSSNHAFCVKIKAEILLDAVIAAIDIISFDNCHLEQIIGQSMVLI